MQAPEPVAATLRGFVIRPLVFLCRPAGRRASTDRFTARVVHFLNSPAGAAEISELRSRLGKCAPQFESFYARHNGFVLYRDTFSNAAGIEAFPIRAWGKATERLHNDVRDMIDEGEEQESSDLFSCAVFATVPQSGNYFAVQTSGKNAGAIHYADHETLLAPQKPFARDFDGFVLRLISEPVNPLSKSLGCFTRYSDGATATQWIPTDTH